MPPRKRNPGNLRRGKNSASPGQNAKKAAPAEQEPAAKKTKVCFEDVEGYTPNPDGSDFNLSLSLYLPEMSLPYSPKREPDDVAMGGNDDEDPKGKGKGKDKDKGIATSSQSKTPAKRCPLCRKPFAPTWLGNRKANPLLNCVCHAAGPSQTSGPVPPPTESSITSASDDPAATPPDDSPPPSNTPLTAPHIAAWVRTPIEKSFYTIMSEPYKWIPPLDLAGSKTGATSDKPTVVTSQVVAAAVADFYNVYFRGDELPKHWENDQADIVEFLKTHGPNPLCDYQPFRQPFRENMTHERVLYPYMRDVIQRVLPAAIAVADYIRDRDLDLTDDQRLARASPIDSFTIYMSDSDQRAGVCDIQIIAGTDVMNKIAVVHFEGKRAAVLRTGSRSIFPTPKEMTDLQNSSKGCPPPADLKPTAFDVVESMKHYKWQHGFVYDSASSHGSFRSKPIKLYQERRPQKLQHICTQLMLQFAVGHPCTKSVLFDEFSFWLIDLLQAGTEKSLGISKEINHHDRAHRYSPSEVMSSDGQPKDPVKIFLMAFQLMSHCTQGILSYRDLFGKQAYSESFLRSWEQWVVQNAREFAPWRYHCIHKRPAVSDENPFPRMMAQETKRRSIFQTRKANKEFDENGYPQHFDEYVILEYITDQDYPYEGDGDDDGRDEEGRGEGGAHGGEGEGFSGGESDGGDGYEGDGDEGEGAANDYGGERRPADGGARYNAHAGGYSTSPLVRDHLDVPLNDCWAFLPGNGYVFVGESTPWALVQRKPSPLARQLKLNFNFQNLACFPRTDLGYLNLREDFAASKSKRRVQTLNVEICFTANFDRLEYVFGVRCRNAPIKAMVLKICEGARSTKILHEAAVYGRLASLQGRGIPSLIGVYAFDRSNGLAILTTLAGKALSQDPEQVLSRLQKTQLLDTVQRMHRLGIVHGDIAARNIVISPSGTPLLVDFGNSKFTLDEQLFVAEMDDVLDLIGL